MRRKKPPRPYLMPVEMVLNHPSLIVLKPAAYRAVATVSMLYWQAGCPAPDDEVIEALVSSCRLHGGVWAHVRPQAFAALRQVLPELAHAHATAVAHREQVNQAARSAGLRSVAIRRAKAAEAQRPLDAAVHTQTAARYANPAAPASPQELAQLQRRELARPGPAPREPVAPLQHAADPSLHPSAGPARYQRQPSRPTRPGYFTDT